MQSQTVLVIDDSVLVLGIVGRALMERGIRVVSAASAHEASSLLERESVSLILLDPEMSRLAGLQFLERIRKVPEWRDLPVMIISAGTDAKARVRAAQLGAVEFIRKDECFAETMVAVVEKRLKRSQPRERLKSLF